MAASGVNQPSLMESDKDIYGDFTVFTGSSEQDVMCCKIFWNSVTLQPPLESRLVSGDMEQRLKAAGSPKLRRNSAQQQLLEDLKTEYFILEAQKEERLKQKAVYLEKAKRREEIIALLKKQREDRMKKEAVSLAYKPVMKERESR
ncbi:cilia- and flagella-associated protein HOATZ [Spea bombifrons]|uniref:cilia- and flagella-associated protein HOATZ n=1 Tax=Spea bombifrons TaxID=233779 RepID=UPI0023499EE5|nr:cilia- and flagella-associated protein HOATZ [Spea bombifrons]